MKPGCWTSESSPFKSFGVRSHECENIDVSNIRVRIVLAGCASHSPQIQTSRRNLCRVPLPPHPDVPSPVPNCKSIPIYD
jgi:hypothetical protein